MKNLKLILALALATGASAAPQHWEIDTDHATVGFSVRHMMVSNVTGSFKKFAGGVDVDPADPTTAVIKAEIDAASVTTANDKRDEHLRTADFFDTAKFPTITFVSKKVEKDGEKFKLTGDLTMHGVTKEVVFDMDAPSEAIQDPWKNTRRGISATGKLNRKDFGLTWSKSLDGGGVVVGDEVKFSLEIELLQKAAAPASPEASPSPAK